jgi:hypothetical protein
MARPLRISFPGAFYHITSRGNEQKAVFKSRRDRGKFLDVQTATYDLKLGGDPRFARKVKIFLCRKLTAESLNKIGEQFGIGDSAVSQSYSRFLSVIETDRRLRSRVAKIEKTILCNVEP